MKQKLNIMGKQFSAAIALLSAQLLLALLSFIIALSVLIIVIREIFYDKEYHMDEQVFSFLSHYVNETNTMLMKGISFMGSQYFLIPGWLVLLLCCFLIRKNKWMTAKIFIVAVSNLLLMLILKLLFNRPRPLIPLLKNVPGLSFPSGHAFMSLVFYGMVMYVLYREVKSNWLKWTAIGVMALVVLTIGLSRVYLRVHYASDVIAGYCFGIISLLILFWLLRQIEKYHAKSMLSPLNVTKTLQDSN